VSPIYGHGELVEEFTWVVGNSFCHRDGLIEKGRGLRIGCRFVIWVFGSMDVREPENLCRTLREREEKE
jgi:hypothetical protein